MSDDAKLVLMRESQEIAELPIHFDEIFVGREDTCHIVIPSAMVSRKHCSLTRQQGRLVVKDLGSSNGTYVNGDQIREQTVYPGDDLEIGPLTFVVRYTADSEADEAPQAAAATSADQPAADAELTAADLVEDDDETAFAALLEDESPSADDPSVPPSDTDSAAASVDSAALDALSQMDAIDEAASPDFPEAMEQVDAADESAGSDLDAFLAGLEEDAE